MRSCFSRGEWDGLLKVSSECLGEVGGGVFAAEGIQKLRCEVELPEEKE